MINECEYCGKTFEKLSQFYMHKNTHTPSLLLHQHPHPAFGVDAKQIVPVSSNRIDPKHGNDLNSKDSWAVQKYDRNRVEYNKKPNIVENYDRRIKRKRDEHDSDLEIMDSYDRNNKRRKNNEYDSGFQIMDSYDRIDKKIKRGIKKKDRIANRKYINSLSDNEQRNPNLKIVDRYDRSIKRKRDENDSDLEIRDSYNRSGKRRREDENDPGLEIVDSYDRSEKKRRREIEKKNRAKNRKFKNVSDEDKRNPNLKVLDNYNQSFKEDCKKCEKEKSDLKKEIEDVIKNCNKRIEEEKDKCRDNIKNIKETCRDILETKDRQHKADITELNEQFEKSVKQKEEIYKVELDNREEEHEDEIKTKNEEFEEMKNEFEEKIDVLIKHKKWEDEEEETITPLAQAIFNCTTIGEIFEIENLIKSQRINELQDKHYKTLQNMFLSLSYGILPICQPQRNTITETQRKIVEKIQGSSKSTAKKLVLENREEIANLFSIIEDSLVLARNSFNRYGNR